MSKNVRFGDLVRNSGRPSVHTLWTKPGRDKTFTQAIKQNRVLTVVQEPTSKRKDYGEMASRRRKGTPYQSAMSMLNFYINRAGAGLPGRQKQVLQRAKGELRKVFGFKIC